MRLTKNVKNVVVRLLDENDVPQNNPYNNGLNQYNIKDLYHKGIINIISSITPLYNNVSKSEGITTLTLDQFSKCVEEYLKK